MFAVAFATNMFFPAYLSPGFTANQAQLVLFGLCTLLYLGAFFGLRTVLLEPIPVALWALAFFVVLVTNLIAVSHLALTDYLNSFRLPIYAVIFVTSLTYCWYYPQLGRRLVLVAGGVSIAFGLVQWVVPFNSAMGLFTETTFQSYVLRINSFFVWAYNYAFFLSFFLYWSLIEFLLRRDRRAVNLLFFIICLVSVYMTQSRIGYASVLLGIVLVFFLVNVVFRRQIEGYMGEPFTKGLRRTTLTLFSLATVLAVVFFVLFPPTLVVNLFLALQGQTNDGSLQTRLAQIAFALEQGSRSYFMLGAGPNKEMELVENWYMDALLKYGIPYIVFFISALGYMVIRLLASIRSKADVAAFRLALAQGVFLLTLFPFLMSGSLIDGFRMSFYFYFFLGWVFAMLRGPSKGGLADV